LHESESNSENGRKAVIVQWIFIASKAVYPITKLVILNSFHNLIM